MAIIKFSPTKMDRAKASAVTIGAKQSSQDRLITPVILRNERTAVEPTIVMDPNLIVFMYYLNSC